MEAWGGVTRAIVAWIKIPSLSTTSSFYIHYGDTSITTSQQSRSAVWTGGYEMVLHLTGGDSTAKNTPSSANVNASTGIIATAASFNGATSATVVGSATAIDDIFTGGSAMDAWIRPASFEENMFGRIMEKNNNGGWLWMVENGNSPAVMSFQCGAATTIGRWRSPDSTITLNQWQHVALVYEKTNAPQMYINGAAITVVTVTPPVGAISADAASSLVVGNDTAGDHSFVAHGGLAAMAERIDRKARILYDFTAWRGHAEPASRSRMNVTFLGTTPQLETTLLARAEAAGLSGLQGHRSVGGLRASIYNAFPEEGVTRLVPVLDDVEHGR